MLRFKKFFVSHSGSNDSHFFLWWQHELPFLICLHFCFVFTKLLHDLSCVTILNKHFIKHRINCLFYELVFGTSISGYFFGFSIGHKHFRAADIYYPFNNLKLSIFCGEIGIFHFYFCHYILQFSKLCKSIWLFMWCTVNVKVLSTTNRTYYKKDGFACCIEIPCRRRVLGGFYFYLVNLLVFFYINLLSFSSLAPYFYFCISEYLSSILVLV